MISREKLAPILASYKSKFLSIWKNEKYKWENVKYFQDRWNLDAENFGTMFEQATAKTANLLASGYAYPRAMIINFAKADDEGTRTMFRDLADESQDLAVRVEAFQAAAEAMRAKYDDGTWRNHYQNTNAISTYLWLMFPEKYYIYKYGLYQAVSKDLAADYTPKANGSVETMIGGFKMYDEVCAALSEDEELLALLRQALTPACHSDTAYRTLTIDFGHYVGSYYVDEKKAKKAGEGWIPEGYVSPLSVEDWKALIANTSVFTAGSLQIMKRIKDYGGQATCTQLAVKYGESANFYNTGASTLAKRVAEEKGFSMVELRPGEERWWPILFLGKAAEKDDEGVFIWKLRDELNAALDQIDLDEVELYAKAESADAAHGFWWLTANPKIWSFADIKIGEEQSYTLYNESGNKRRVFQNFLDAKAGDILIGYEANPVKKVVALGRITQENDGKAIHFEKTEGLAVHIDYSALRDAPELEKMEFFVQPNGSLFKLSKGEFDFIMDIIRESNPLRQPDAVVQKYTKADFLSKVYMTEERFDVLVALLKNKKNIILQGALGVGKTFTAKKLAYAIMEEVDESRIEMVQFHQNYSYEDFVMGYRPDGADFKLTEGIFYRFCQTAANHPDQPFFFIIDEINRGNMSKIFGELLMLIDRDYRGTKATLAYSGMPFSVPENLYIIGMMNTADRSLAMIDYALRRRFSFFDMDPGFNSEGFVKYQEAFANETFNALINQVKQLNREILEDKSLGRGFQIGHSYFCGREVLGCSDEWMRSVVEFDILPTLGEYWFDEPKKLAYWEKICVVFSMTKDKSIFIKNIYYMLSYAFQVLKQSNYEEVSTEDFDHVEDLFAAILARGISRQLKQGLYRTYITKQETLSVMRGKLDMPGTIRNRIQRKTKLDCIFDELSENNVYNQILKTTAQYLVRAEDVDPERKGALKKVLVFFDGIDVLEPSTIQWGRLHYQRNNRNYELLINICYFVLDGMLQTTESGDYRVVAFSDEHMARLYEKFILEYYREHHTYLSEVKAAQVKWDITGDTSAPLVRFLPAMQTDITLRLDERVLIIDAKYYGKTLQQQFDKYSLHSGNVYQIYSYVKNLDTRHTGNVGGVLLYAKTDEDVTPDGMVEIGNNMIGAKTLDLNVDFRVIAAQLDKIASDFFTLKTA